MGDRWRGSENEEAQSLGLDNSADVEVVSWETKLRKETGWGRMGLSFW